MHAWLNAVGFRCVWWVTAYVHVFSSKSLLSILHQQFSCMHMFMGLLARVFEACSRVLLAGWRLGDVTVRCPVFVFLWQPSSFSFAAPFSSFLVFLWPSSSLPFSSLLLFSISCLSSALSPLLYLLFQPSFASSSLLFYLLLFPFLQVWRKVLNKK